jgi:hypothetical protein
LESAKSTASSAAIRIPTNEKHGELFMPLLPKYIAHQTRSLNAADEALELFKFIIWAWLKRWRNWIDSGHCPLVSLDDSKFGNLGKSGIGRHRE